MKSEDHIRRYKQMRSTLYELLSKPINERDNASIVTIAHWASYHLVSVIIDQLEIPERFKRRNHRGVKDTLKQPELKNIIGEPLNKILEIYNTVESDFLIKFQYGSISKSLNQDELKELLKELEIICKRITDKVQINTEKSN